MSWTLPGDWKELTSSELSLVLGRRGCSHTRRFSANWDSALANCPPPGDPSPWLAAAVVERVTIRGIGEPVKVADGGPAFEMAYVDVEYNADYDRPGLGQPPRATFDYGVEFLSNTGGRIWASDSKAIPPDAIPQCTPYPVTTITFELCMTADVLFAGGPGLQTYVGKINSTTWNVTTAGLTLALQTECLLLDGAAAAGEWDPANANWYYHVTYKFTLRPQSWQQVWRTADYIRDSGGVPLWNDSTKQFTLAVDGSSVPLSGKWDSTTPLIYPTVDFAGLPGF